MSILFQFGKVAAELMLRRKRKIKVDNSSTEELAKQLHAQSSNQQDPYSFGRKIHDRKAYPAVQPWSGNDRKRMPSDGAAREDA